MKRACQPITLFAIVVLLAFVLAACGGGSSAGTPSVTASTSPTETPAPIVTEVPTAAHEGPLITAADSTTSLPVLADAEHYWNPIAGSTDGIVMQAQPSKGPQAETDPSTYYLWDPKTGSMTQLWTDPGGIQENGVMEGDWFVGVPRGFGGTGGADQWSLVLHNVKTGETRKIAEAQPELYRLLNSQITSYINPSLAISNGRVVWTEIEIDELANVTSRVKMYDISDGATTTLAEQTAPSRQVIWSAAIGGSTTTIVGQTAPFLQDSPLPGGGGLTVAWLYNDGTTDNTRIVVRDMDDGATSNVDLDRAAYSLAVSPDGANIAWDAPYYDKYLTNRAGQTTFVARSKGYGLFFSGGFVSWDPATISGGQTPSGLYNLKTQELRELIPERQALTNVGHAFGDWFLWQDVPVVGSEYRDDQGHWRVMPLPD